MTGLPKDDNVESRRFIFFKKGSVAGMRINSCTTKQHGTILLVEDDENDALLFDLALKQTRILNPLQIVQDGEEALDYLKGKGKYSDRNTFPLPCLVILDLKLPKRTGFEVLQWLKIQDGLKRLPVVVLSSSGEMKDLERAYDLGANSYLVKPIEFDGLLDMVNTLSLYWFNKNIKPPVTPGGHLY